MLFVALKKIKILFEISSGCDQTIWKNVIGWDCHLQHVILSSTHMDQSLDKAFPMVWAQLQSLKKCDMKAKLFFFNLNLTFDELILDALASILRLSSMFSPCQFL